MATASFFYEGDCRPGDRAATTEEIAAREASLPKIISFSTWLGLFTPAEKEWAFDAARPWQIKQAITQGAALGSIDLTSPETRAFIDLCISIGSPLTAARKTEILAGTLPQ